MCILAALWAMGCEDEPETMKGNPTTWKLLAWAAGSVPEPGVLPPPVVEEDDDTLPDTLKDQRNVLFRRMQAYFGLPDETVAAVRQIFEESAIMGQGNPVETKPPMTRSECFRIRKEAGLSHVDDPVCGIRNMVPLYKAKEGQKPEDAPFCIDQYEFPNMPCEYPVVHVTTREAALLCKAVGKRLCDAHEWEGACAGYLRDPKDEYAFGRDRRDMKAIHNNNREVLWAYGKQKNHALCGTGSSKSKECHGGGYRRCGSNTFPAGAFPKCVSPLGVFDLHGNAAEHMNLPMKPDELASLGKYGQTEMKGSWFIFGSYEAHEDDCHWRAPDWHATGVMSTGSHSNYHLGFRCCVNVDKKKRDADASGKEQENL
jgi:hypothetical protein